MKLLDSNQTAEYLGITPRQVMRLARENVIPNIKLPTGDICFIERDLERWVESQKQGPVYFDETPTLDDELKKLNADEIQHRLDRISKEKMLLLVLLRVLRRAEKTCPKTGKG